MFGVPYHILIHDKTCIAVIFYLSILIYGAGGVQNMAIWGVETGYYGRLVMGRGPRLETYLCAIPHLITWLNMCNCARVIFDLSWYLYGAGGLQNMVIFRAKPGLYNSMDVDSQ